MEKGSAGMQSKTNETAANEPTAAADPVASSQSLSKPTIRVLTIERFRGIKALAWRPGPGLNVILGGGDVGKTTILDAIALLLSPTNFGTLSDTDYYGRKIQDGFAVEAVMTLPSDGIVKLSRIRLTDPQDDGLKSRREPGMLGVDHRDSA